MDAPVAVSSVNLYASSWTHHSNPVGSQSKVDLHTFWIKKLPKQFSSDPHWIALGCKIS